MISLPLLLQNFQSDEMKALMTRFPEGYSCLSYDVCVFCAYSAQQRPVIWIRVNQSATTISTESMGDFLPDQAARCRSLE